jgi:glycosyltransferase involved in cell wall biosynthesis
VVSNAAFVDFAYPHPEPRDPNIHGLRLGHLSNLTIEKGLDVVIDVFEESPEEVTLTIYGAPTDDRSRILLDNALRRNPDRLRHVTPSNREGVWNFFDSVDLFLFPSRYRNEAAPLVILEALATGTPVLATERGCIRSQLSPELEEFVYSEDDFRARAVEVVIALNSDARLRKAVGIRSLRQWRRLEAAADPQKNALLSLVSRY